MDLSSSGNTKGIHSIGNLCEACKSGNLQKVKDCISQGIDINITHKEWDDINKVEAERTPLQYAASAGNLEIARFLIENGANVNRGRVDNGATPLYAAVSQGHLEVIRL